MQIKLKTPDTYPTLTGSAKQTGYASRCRESWLRSANQMAAEINAASPEESAQAMPMLQSIVDAVMADTDSAAWINRASVLSLMQSAIRDMGPY